MIMRNISKEITQTNNCGRTFTNILHEAHKHWDEFRYDEANKKASGLIVTADGKVFTAELSYNDITNRLALTVRLQVNRELNTSCMLQILRYQQHHNSLSCFLTLDDECRMASVRANTAVYEKEPSLAVDCVFSDTCKLLKDSELNELLN